MLKPLKISIIHPEGNINNNPHLSGFVDLLDEAGYLVQVISPFKPSIYQNKPNKNCDLKLLKTQVQTEGFIADFQSSNSLDFLELHQCDIVIGVDRGIIEAAQLAQKFNTRLGLISYEIFFAKECQPGFKTEEIQACSLLDFAIVQDELRAQNLSVENKIPREKMLLSPVASASWSNEFQKTSYLHEKFQIAPHKKIALFMGMVDFWSGFTEMVELFGSLENEWELVIHNRYGLDGKTRQHMNLVHHKNIHFSTQAFENPKDLKILVQGADLGIAFYKPNFNSIYTGRNIQDLGLASGKISSYLQYGTPILINEIGEMANHVRNSQLGLVLGPNTRDEILLFNSNSHRGNAFRFYKQSLDLRRFFPMIQQKLESLRSKPSTQNSMIHQDPLKVGLEFYQAKSWDQAILSFEKSPVAKEICEANIQKIHSQLADQYARSKIVVYQMGKVGSNTVHRNLRAQLPQRETLETHFISDKEVRELLERRAHQNPLPTWVQNSVQLNREIKLPQTPNWQIITLIRDPVAINVSSFFEEIEIWIPNVRQRVETNNIHVSEVLDVFYNEFKHDYPTNWFDREFKVATGIDIYSFDYDVNRDYQIYWESPIPILMIKMEQLSKVFSTSLGQFLNKDIKMVDSYNVGAKKFYHQLKKDFENQVVFSDELFNQMYLSKHVQHFYSPSEIQSFRKKWLRL